MPTPRLRASLLAAGLAAIAAHAAAVPVPTASPALAALAAPHGPLLRDAGIHRIVAREGSRWTDVQILTAWGAVYFAWPPGIMPAAFELDVNGGGTVNVRAIDGADAARYAAALDAVVAEAVRRARDAQARAERPRP